MAILFSIIIGLVFILTVIAVIKTRNDDKRAKNKIIITQCARDIHYIEHALISASCIPIPPEAQIILYARIDRLLHRINQLDPNKDNITTKRAMITNTIKELRLLKFQFELPLVFNEQASRKSIKALYDVRSILHAETKRKKHHPHLNKIINILNFYLVYYKAQTAITTAQNAYKNKFYSVARKNLIIAQRVLYQNKNMTEGTQWINKKLDICNKNIPQINKVIAKENKKDKSLFAQASAPKEDDGLSRVITEEKMKS